MPIYEYQCSDCGHKFDEIQKVDAPPLTDCEACGKESLVKLMSAPSFRLKGQGWYETDFKKENRRNLAGDSSSESSSSAEAKSGTDSKSSDGKKADKAASGGDKAAATPAKTPPKKAGGDARKAAGAD